MTEATTDIEESKTALERMMEEGGDDGLGDLGGSTPRIKILHRDAMFEENTSGLQVPSFEGIICGRITQRVLWKPDPDSGDAPKPWCKSINGEVGRPDPKNFPLEPSKLDLVLTDGCEAMCSDCNLKEWDTHPTRKGPWCSEQIVLIVMADMLGTGEYSPAILSVQRSGLKATRQHLRYFQKARTPAFTNYTTFSLQPKRVGMTEYCEPVFKHGTETPKEEWETYAQNYLDIKEFLQTWRGDEEEDVPATATVDTTEDIPEF